MTKTTLTIFFLFHVVFGNVLDRNDELSRRRPNKDCSGVAKQIYLSQGEGSEVLLQSPGFASGDFMENCETLWEVMIDRDDQDLAQWRIKVVVEEMNLYCSSSSLWILEEAEKVHNVEYCNEKTTSKTVFYSHEHMIEIKLKNQRKCKQSGGCEGTRVQMRVSAEYVCGGRYTKDNGVITSPFYPANYINSETCFYDIVAPRRKRIAFTCDEFNLSTRCEGRCGSHNGQRTYLQDLATMERYEGRELRGKTIKSRKNFHTFYFISNSKDIENDKRSYGFNCTYNFF